MLLIVLLFATLGYLLVKVGGYNSKRGREREDLSKSLIVAGGPFFVKLSYKKNIISDLGGKICRNIEFYHPLPTISTFLSYV